MDSKIYSEEEAYQASLDYFGGDELAAKVFIDKYALRDTNLDLVEKTPSDMHRRIAKEFARIEKKKFKNPYSEEEIFNFLDGFKRGVMQGSPMYGIGNPYQYVSIGNCFVLPSPLDSYLSILHTDTQITQISCRRGGVGWDVSMLRPNGMKVRNAARTTSGTIEFMKRFSNTIREVGQHGRRGASLQSMSCYHPEIMNFIKVKQDLKEVTGSNISVQFTDEFMEAVINDKPIKLRFPCTPEHAEILGKNFPEFEQDANAKEIWKEFIHSAWLMAEPGCMFIDNVHKDSPGVPYGHKEVSSNPCGEQYLPQYASCRLILLNLYGYVKDKFTPEASFDFESFKKDVQMLQRLGDDLVDIEIECVDKIIKKIKSDPEPIEIKRVGIELWENVKKTALLDRRTGCGITGLGDVVAALGMRYASEESIDFIEELQKTYALEAYRSSVEMAKELGAFPQFDPKLDIQSGFVQKIAEADPELFKKMQKYGRRNMVLLTIAPTGSVSCLTQTSSGLEPVFNLSYMRRKKGNPGDKGFKVDFTDENGDHWMHFDIYHKGFKDWMEVSGKTAVEESPYYQSTANDIDWISRVKLQSKLQKWIDNSISSTINLPKDTTEEMVSDIYLAAYKYGCKGVTIYREGCRDGVLVNTEPVKPEVVESAENTIIKTRAPKRKESMKADVYHPTAKGIRYYVAVGLMSNEPYEIFVGMNHNNEGDPIIPKTITEGEIVKRARGKYELVSGENVYSLTNGHSDPNADALTRMISTALRHGSGIEFVVAQLEKTKGGDLQSFSRILARTLKKYIQDGKAVSGATCSECHQETMIYESGCHLCKNCGASKCS